MPTLFEGIRDRMGKVVQPILGALGGLFGIERGRKTDLSEVKEENAKAIPKEKEAEEDVEKKESEAEAVFKLSQRVLEISESCQSDEEIHLKVDPKRQTLIFEFTLEQKISKEKEKLKGPEIEKTPKPETPKKPTKK